MNTLDIDAGRDELATGPATRAWLRRWGLLGPRGSVDRPELLRFREQLRTALGTHDIDHDRGDGPSAPIVEMAAHPVVIGIDPAGAVSLSAANPEDPIGRLLAIVGDAARGPDWPRLKVCANDACRWVFFDQSRNGAGRWCTMRRCGTLMNVRAFRRRRRSGSNATAAPVRATART